MGNFEKVKVYFSIDMRAIWWIGSFKSQEREGKLMGKFYLFLRPALTFDPVEAKKKLWIIVREAFEW